jgi:hypothetical protein
LTINGKRTANFVNTNVGSNLKTPVILPFEKKNMIKYLNIIWFIVVPSILWGQVKKTEVLVFGTVHLAQMKGFEPQFMDSIIESLDDFKFDVVCIEKMRGQLLYDIKNRNDRTFNEIINGRWGKPYLDIADTVQKVFNINFINAQKTIVDILKKERLSIGDRKILFNNYLAATDIPSAALQYKYLSDNDYNFSDFDKYLIAQIQKEINTRSEFYTLAIPLALHQKLNEIEAINDYQDESLLFNYFPDFVQDCQSKSDFLSKISQLPVYKKTNELTVNGIKTRDLSDLFLFLNSDEYKTQDYKGQWAIWFETKFESGSDRARYSLWEMRNLQITSNILNVVALNSGKNILVIIGSSHTSFIEKYLRQIEDIKVLTYE